MFSWRLELALAAGLRLETHHFADPPTRELSIFAHRNVKFVLVQAQAPVVPRKDSLKDPLLKLTADGRLDRYSDFGASFSPKFGVLYSPFHDLKVRGSWSRSFRAPSLLQLGDPSTAVLEYVPDVSSPTGRSLVELRYGGNPQLKAEVARTYSVNVTLTPSIWPGASFELTWYDIQYKGRIQSPTAHTMDPLSDPYMTPFVYRSPELTLVREITGQSRLLDLTGGAGDLSAVTAIVDDRHQNIGQQRASGVDLRCNYDKPVTHGELETSLNIAYLDLRQRVTAASPLVQLSGTAFYPPTYRSRASLGWKIGPYSVNATFNYSSPGRNWTVVPSQRIASWSTLDLHIDYDRQRIAKSGIRLSLWAQNVLDRQPPYVKLTQTTLPQMSFDANNASPVGVFVGAQLALRF